MVAYYGKNVISITIKVIIFAIEMSFKIQWNKYIPRVTYTTIQHSAQHMLGKTCNMHHCSAIEYHKFLSTNTKVVPSGEDNSNFLQTYYSKP